MSWNSSKPRLFQFQHVKMAVDNWVALRDSPGLLESWALAQEIIEAQGRFLQRFWPEQVARAKAWEDFDVACRGHAGPGISGAVFELWSNTEPEYQDELRNVLTVAFEKAQMETDARFLRYSIHDRTSRVRTLSDGLSDRYAVPSDTALTNEDSHASKPKQHPVFTVLPGGRGHGD